MSNVFVGTDVCFQVCAFRYMQVRFSVSKGPTGPEKLVYYGSSAGSVFLNRGKYSGRGDRLVAKEQITAGTLHILGTAMALSSN